MADFHDRQHSGVDLGFYTLSLGLVDVVSSIESVPAHKKYGRLRIAAGWVPAGDGQLLVLYCQCNVYAIDETRFGDLPECGGNCGSHIGSHREL